MAQNEDIRKRYADLVDSMMLGRMSGGLFADMVFVDPAGVAPNNEPVALSDARKHVERWLLKDEQHVAWADVIGNEPAKQMLQEAVEASTKHPDLYAHYGMVPPRGALLWGGPGNGKTMLAKAVVSALSEILGGKSEMIMISGPELDNKYIGETEKYIRQIFTYAREYAAHHKRPLVVFIDEADSVLQTRDGNWPWRDGMISQFLSEMDGLKPNGAFVLLATNRPDAIDPAFLRPGRIDYKIRVERPDLDNVERILLSLRDKAVRAFEKSGAEGYITATSFHEREVAEYIFDPRHLIDKIYGKSGAEYHFTLSHIISGAMVVNLLARAKVNAFRRDIAANTQSGLTLSDWLFAVDSLFEEQKGLSHSYAMEEFLTDIALPVEQVQMEGGTMQ